MTAVYIIVIVFTAALAGVSLSTTLLTYMRDGMILSRYRKFLEKLPPFLGKPLGLCVYCNSPHTTTLLLVLFLLVTNISVSFWGFVFGYFFVHIFARLLSKISINKFLDTNIDVQDEFYDVYKYYYGDWQHNPKDLYNVAYVEHLTKKFSTEEKKDFVIKAEKFNGALNLIVKNSVDIEADSN